MQAAPMSPRYHAPRPGPMGAPTRSAAAFAEQMLLRPLWPHQVPAVDSDAFIVTIAGGRRSGKSLAAQATAIHIAATLPLASHLPSRRRTRYRQRVLTTPAGSGDAAAVVAVLSELEVPSGCLACDESYVLAVLGRRAPHRCSTRMLHRGRGSSHPQTNRDGDRRTRTRTKTHRRGSRRVCRSTGTAHHHRRP